MKYESTLKKNLGGKISGKRLRGAHEAQGKALKKKIEEKREGIRKERNEKELSGIKLFK